MSCLSIEELAAGDADAHAAECLACRRALDEQRDLRSSLAALRMPVLADDRRRRLAAEVMAAADAPVRSTRWRYAAVAAAAVIAVVLYEPDGTLALRKHESIVHRDPSRHDVHAPTIGSPRKPTTATAGDATTSDTGGVPSSNADDPLADNLRDNPRADNPNADDLRNNPRADNLRADNPRADHPRADHPDADNPRADNLRDSPRADRPHSDKSRAIFGGSGDNRVSTVEHDDLLVANPSLVAFRAGWEALRANRYDDAIAAFDRATEPVVAEDAAFWAAIAAQRAGRLDEARRRLTAFASRFPESPRAQRALDALR